ncbi:MAG: hypothetical protein GWP10_12620, partial [Nitrospiraceae bacterium]|nr:hypothetical protein [Nitrospiraceae bacterium]
MFIIKLDKTGNVAWARTYGGSKDDWANSIQQTSDEGYIVAGGTYSFGAGSKDTLIIKLDKTGNVAWARTYGGSKDETIYFVQQTSDRGYIFTGYTSSFGAGNKDILVVKLDSSGNIQWAKTYGGKQEDNGWYRIRQTDDGGYILSSYTYSFGAGYDDILIIKLDSSGNIQWAKTYGGKSGDNIWSIISTSDGGYILGGESYFDIGGWNLLVVKLDSVGNITWTKRLFGGSNKESGSFVCQTLDGGYVVAGYITSSSTGKSSSIIIKLDANGNMRWAKTYGGKGNDYIESIQQTSDGGYIVGGVTDSFGTGKEDAFVMRLDINGNIPGSGHICINDVTANFTMVAVTLMTTIPNPTVNVITSSISSSSPSLAVTSPTVQSTTIYNSLSIVTNSLSNANLGVFYSQTLTASGGTGSYIWSITSGSLPSGLSLSPSTGVVSGTPTSIGTSNFTVQVTSGTQTSKKNFSITIKSSISSNAKGWIKAYGGNGRDHASSIQQTMDGGYIVAGESNSFSFGAGDRDLLIIKLGANGNVTWARTFGGMRDESVSSVQQTQDGGYIVAGYTWSFGAGHYDFLIIKLDANGNITWAKTYGGNDDDYALSIQETSDRGYIVAGHTESFGTGDNDFLVIKLDPSGNVNWAKTFGRSGGDYEASSIQQTMDGGYIIAGKTGIGNCNILIIKLDPSGNVNWAKIFGGSDDYGASSVQQTSDGGYIVAGGKIGVFSGCAALIIKLDASGNINWAKTYGGRDWDEANSVQQTSDGGYIVAGYTKSFSPGGDALIIKLDAKGNKEWAKIYKGEGSSLISSIQQTSDSGYVAAGYTDTESFSTKHYENYDDFLVIKLDANGDIPGSNCSYLKDVTADVDIKPKNVAATNVNLTITSSFPLVTSPYLAVTSPTIEPKIICRGNAVVYPSAPQDLTATATTSSITLNWTYPTQGTYPVAGYAIYRGTTSGGESNTPIATVDANTTIYTDNNVETGRTYYYIVKAFDNKKPPNYSKSSNEVEAEIKNMTPP